MEAAFWTLVIIASAAGVFALLALIAAFFEWATERVDRWVDGIISEWADHD